MSPTVVPIISSLIILALYNMVVSTLRALIP